MTGGPDDCSTCPLPPPHPKMPFLEGCPCGPWEGDVFLGALSFQVHSVGPESPQSPARGTSTALPTPAHLLDFPFRQGVAGNLHCLSHSGALQVCKAGGAVRKDARGSSPPTVVRMLAWDSPPASCKAGFLLDLSSSKNIKAYYNGVLEPEVLFPRVWGGIHSPTPNLLWFLGRVRAYACLTGAMERARK